jgi:hypothetical protein
MSFPVVAFGYPLLLAILCIGTGLLVERTTGVRMPAALVPLTGFSALVVISQFTVLSSVSAPLTPEVLALVSLVGFALDRGAVLARWRKGSSNRWWLPLAAAATYLTVASPLIASGDLTFPGYLLDTTAGIHLAGAEYLLHHGYSLPANHPAYGAALHVYYGTGYPSGGQVLMAATGWLSGQDLLWLYFPFQVCALALTALGLAFLAARAGLSRGAAAVSGWIAAVPALVTAYAMMGSIKEISALPSLTVLGVSVLLVRRSGRRRVRDAVPFSLAAAAAIGSIGLSALAWIVLAALAGATCWLPSVATLRRNPAGAILRWAVRSAIALGAAAALLVVLVIPTLSRLSAVLGLASGLSGSNSGLASDPGNLLRPLRFVQVFGVWMGGSHRVDPKYLNQTYLLIGIVIVCVGLGVMTLIRRRAWPLLLWLLASLIVWLALYERGTEWTDAKVMMLSSPLIVLVAMMGAFGDIGRYRRQAIALAVAVALAVLASDGLAYHGTTMAPSSRFTELRWIGERFAGQGPTLLPDFDEYAIYLLRKLNIDSPGFAPDMRLKYMLTSGGIGYGHSYDVDQIQAPFVQSERLIVMRRSPRWSRPPGNFTLAWEGRYYEVWRRTGPPPRLHVTAGTATQAAASIPCRQLRTIAREARTSGGVLRYAAGPALAIANLATATISPDVVAASDSAGLPEDLFIGPGTVTSSVRIGSPGLYRLWLGGILDRPLRVSIDGREVASSPASQAGGEGNMIEAETVSLSAGRHAITLVRGGGGFGPGNATVPQAFVDGVYLERSDNAHEAVQTLAPDRWRSLCGRTLDWVEIA